MEQQQHLLQVPQAVGLVRLPARLVLVGVHRLVVAVEVRQAVRVGVLLRLRLVEALHLRAVGVLVLLVLAEALRLLLHAEARLAHLAGLVLVVVRQLILDATTNQAWGLE